MSDKVNVDGIGGAGGTLKAITSKWSKVSGVWKKIISSWEKVSGVWKETGIADVTYTWTGAVDGDWATDGNWDILGYPQGTNDVAIINIADTVTTDREITVKDLTINHAGATLQLGDDMIVKDDVAVTLGVLDMNGNNLTVTDDVTVAGTLQTGGGIVSCAGDWTVTGTWTHENGQLVMNGATAQAFNCAAADAFYDLEFSGAGTKTLGDSFAVARHLTGTATLDPNAKTVTLNGAGTPCNLGTLTFYDLTINKTNAADIITATGGLTITNQFLGTKGTFQMGSYTHTMTAAAAASWTTTATDFVQTEGTSTINFTTSGAQLIGTTGNDFWNVTCDDAVILGGIVVVVNNIFSVAGALSLNNRNLTVKDLTGAGTVTPAGAEVIIVKGDLDIAAWTASGEELKFEDTGQDSNIGVAYTVFDVTCIVPNKVLRFKESVTFTYTGTLTITGTSGNEVQLRSQAEGTQWGIDNANNLESVDYAYIKDSSPVLSNDITATNSTDGGNNDTTTPGWVIS